MTQLTEHERRCEESRTLDGYERIGISCCIVANRYTSLCASPCFSCKPRPGQLAEPTLSPAMASDTSDKPEPPAEVDGSAAAAIGLDQNPMLPSYDPL